MGRQRARLARVPAAVAPAERNRQPSENDARLSPACFYCACAPPVLPMADLKTRPTDASVDAFIDALDSTRRRDESRQLVALMREATGAEPVMWGESIVGFGEAHVVYASGREIDWFEIGFSPRKRALSLYLMPGVTRFDEILSRLGPHRHGAGCLYVTQLQKVDERVLGELIRASVDAVREAWG